MILLAGCNSKNKFSEERISLSGDWQFRIDSLDRGIADKWFGDSCTDKVYLPGSMATNNKGHDIDLNTPWTGDIVDKSYFTDEKYEKYRQKGNIKVPFWLQPEKYYKGAAWYNRDVFIPENWDGKRVTIFLERCHWKTILFVNGRQAGERNSLATPHEYDITDLIRKGSNRISIQVDNRVVVPVGINSHSISDHTQSNWNGITGEISLRAGSDLFIRDVRIYPDLAKKSAKVIVAISHSGEKTIKGKVRLRAVSLYSSGVKKLPVRTVKAESVAGNLEIVIEYPMGNNFNAWSEFDPSLYSMEVTLKNEFNRISDTRSVDFGMREFRTEGTHFTLNGTPVFLRGTLECCIFPLTGYPPTDLESWLSVLQTCRDYGLNTIRFHSWCPPEAAFRAADRLGMFLHIECSSWANQGTSIGNGGEIDRFIYEEGDRILREYGNHPSFCMLAYGNEPAGRKQSEYLGKLLTYWKAKDNRRVYTSAAGWPIIPENEFNLTSAPRIQQWGQGLKSIINSEAPNTLYDFGDIISKYSVPTVSHEIGQWCVYPDFSEIERYTGVLKAKNFEIFRESLEEKGMGDLGGKFLMASGKLQALCYKAEIEAALRTPGFGGFHLLQLHDFPGQGTALVGVLNPFFESKGYITAEEFRMFCNSTVPLTRLSKQVFRTDETFEAVNEIAHWGAEPLKNIYLVSSVTDTSGNIFRKDSVYIDEAVIGSCNPAGHFSMDLAALKVPAKYIYELSITGTSFRNRWDFWVYQSDVGTEPGIVYVTDILDSKAERILSSGGKVLFLTYGKIGKMHGADVAIGFSSIFWNTAWTGNQAPHTLGILCDPAHPLFKSFPTEYHSNWQWWDPVAHSQAMVLDDMPAGIKPLVQPIDTWFENRKLALAFEAKVGQGKLMVCSIDMGDIPDERIVSKQLYSSLLGYMNGESFNPGTELSLKKVNELLK